MIDLVCKVLRLALRYTRNSQLGDTTLLSTKLITQSYATQSTNNRVSLSRPRLAICSSYSSRYNLFTSALASSSSVIVLEEWVVNGVTRKARHALEGCDALVQYLCTKRLKSPLSNEYILDPTDNTQVRRCGRCVTAAGVTAC
jgi:hypothetical protein